MLKFELVQTTNIQLTICYNRKSPIFQSHKSYKSPLALIVPQENFSLLSNRCVNRLIKVLKKHFSRNPFWGFKRNENGLVLKSND